MVYVPEDGGAVVVDAGSSRLRFGFAGDDAPRVCYASTVALGGDQGGGVVTTPSTHFQTKPAQFHECGVRSGVARVVSEGVVDSYDYLTQVWAQSERDMDGAYATRPVIVAEQIGVREPTRRAGFRRQERGQHAQMLFEAVNAPAAFLSSTAVLSCYACGRSTGFVVDAGCDSTIVSPVVDGELLWESIAASSMGGAALDRALLNMLEHEMRVPVLPRYRFERVCSGSENVAKVVDAPELTDSYSMMCKLRICEDIKLDICSTLQDRWIAGAATDERSYELPDGTQVDVSDIQHQVPEFLFNPASLDRPDEYASPHSMLHAALDKLATDQRKLLLENIVVCGGTSTMEGYAERLSAEVSASMTSKLLVPRLVYADAPQREHFAWIGGSILGSLSTFKDLWVTKASYDEEGAARCFETRCP